MIKKQGTKNYWSAAEGAFCCLIDKKRTEFFKKAIKKTIKRGDIVVDAGTGTGILAMFAAHCGAKKVYVIEIDKRNIRTLKRNFFINGYGDKIEIINGDATKVILPEKVDMIICEMIATGLIEELQVPVMNNMLRFGKRNVKVLLRKYESYVDLVKNNSTFFKHKLDIFRYEYGDMPETKSEVFSNKKKYLGVDFSKKNKSKKVNGRVVLNIDANGIINGIRISSRTFFQDGSIFDYSPAYSFPLILPISETKVKKGNKFEIMLKYDVCGNINDINYSICKIGV